MKHGGRAVSPGESIDLPGSRCTICRSAKRGEAEAAITRGLSVRAAAKRFGLSYQSLDRHTRKCLPAALATVDAAPPASEAVLTVRQAADAASERRDRAFSDCLLTEVDLLHRTTLDVLRESREGKWLEVPDPKDQDKTIKVYDHPNVKTTMRAIAEARKNLALIARLTGQLEPKEQDRHTVTFEEFEVLYLRAKRESGRPR